MTSSRPLFPETNVLRQEPLQASGLPARILALLHASEFTTLGDLCRPLPACDKLDADDRALLARIAAYVKAACTEDPPTLNLRD